MIQCDWLNISNIEWVWVFTNLKELHVEENPITTLPITELKWLNYLYLITVWDWSSNDSIYPNTIKWLPKKTIPNSMTMYQNQQPQNFNQQPQNFNQQPQNFNQQPQQSKTLTWQFKDVEFVNCLKWDWLWNWAFDKNWNAIYFNFDKNWNLTPWQETKISNTTKISCTRQWTITSIKGISIFTNLKKLYIWGNKLTTLPIEIWNLNNLEEISLLQNNITTLPNTIWNLTNLSLLDIQENKLTMLPNTIWNLTNLTNLLISNNNLITLPQTITNLTNLQNLYLTWNTQLWNIAYNFLVYENKELKNTIFKITSDYNNSWKIKIELNTPNSNLNETNNTNTSSTNNTNTSSTNNTNTSSTNNTNASSTNTDNNEDIVELTNVWLVSCLKAKENSDYWAFWADYKNYDNNWTIIENDRLQIPIIKANWEYYTLKSKLNKIKTLICSYNNIAKMDSFSNSTKLVPITNLTNINSTIFPNLKTLVFESEEIKDFSSLDFSKLDSLIIENNKYQIQLPNFLSNINKIVLKNTNFVWNNLNISNWVKIIKITYLNQDKKISFNNYWNKILNSIDLSYSQITKMPEWLLDFPNLDYLNLNQTKISKLWKLVDLTWLKYLWLYKTNIDNWRINWEKLATIYDWNFNWDRKNNLYEIKKEWDYIKIIPQNAILDENFRECLENNTYDKDQNRLTITFNNEHKITSNNVDKVNFINCQDFNIKNLTWIKLFSNVTKLNLYNNKIKNISPLLSLTNLNMLDLWNNKWLNIIPLQSLNNLTALWLENDDISNISWFENLTNLQYLYLTWNTQLWNLNYNFDSNKEKELENTNYIIKSKWDWTALTITKK